MKMEPLESTSIAATGHEGLTMQIQFKRGDIYVYKPVTAEDHAKLRKAESAGAYLNRMGVKGVKVEVPK